MNASVQKEREQVEAERLEWIKRYLAMGIIKSEAELQAGLNTQHRRGF